MGWNGGMPRLVRFADRHPEPWANGLGSTVEIARDPAATPFDWRLSVARIDADAPFSLLPGIDRALMALEADPLRLRVSDELRILNQHDVLVFPGEAAVTPSGIVHPGHDLNLMTRRGRIEGILEVLRVDGEAIITVTGEGRAVAVVLEGGLRLRVSDGAGSEIPLTRLDAAVGGAGEGLHLIGTGLLAVARVARATAAG
ncbi:MAG: hypothetical protein JWP75_2301 [Frondihabitans sp.]|nr:hypothetical protein [Frondihabitans sp.]